VNFIHLIAQETDSEPGKIYISGDFGVGKNGIHITVPGKVANPN
jgi:hypothetical protein